MIVRFQEFERYDPMSDAQVVMFMGVTDRGSFHAEVACERSGERRAKRKQFESKVIELMEDGQGPQKVVLDG